MQSLTPGFGRHNCGANCWNLVNAHQRSADGRFRNGKAGSAVFAAVFLLAIHGEFRDRGGSWIRKNYVTARELLADIIFILFFRTQVVLM